MNSFWIDSTDNLVSFDSLNSNLKTDVCIIGGGMFGLSTAYYLAKKGLKVSVLEKDFIGCKASGYTTAKITSQHGLIYKHFIDDYGSGFAEKYLKANEQAINNIAEIVENENIIKQSSNSLLFDKFSPASIHCDIENNTGKVVEVDGEKVGIYKDENGNVFGVKPFCTHLGCLLSWNNVDKTWDCPCHGSRFDKFGHNIYDPAVKDLDSKKFDE